MDKSDEQRVAKLERDVANLNRTRRPTSGAGWREVHTGHVIIAESDEETIKKEDPESDSALTATPPTTPARKNGSAKKPIPKANPKNKNGIARKPASKKESKPVVTPSKKNPLELNSVGKRTPAAKKNSRTISKAELTALQEDAEFQPETLAPNDEGVKRIMPKRKGRFTGSYKLQKA